MTLAQCVLGALYAASDGCSFQPDVSFLFDADQRAKAAMCAALFPGEEEEGSGASGSAKKDSARLAHEFAKTNRMTFISRNAILTNALAPVRSISAACGSITCRMHSSTSAAAACVTDKTAGFGKEALCNRLRAVAAWSTAKLLHDIVVGGLDRVSAFAAFANRASAIRLDSVSQDLRCRACSNSSTASATASATATTSATATASFTNGSGIVD